MRINKVQFTPCGRPISVHGVVNVFVTGASPTTLINLNPRESNWCKDMQRPRFLSNSLSQYSTHYVEFSLKIVAKSSKLKLEMVSFLVIIRQPSKVGEQWHAWFALDLAGLKMDTITGEMSDISLHLSMQVM